MRPWLLILPLLLLSAPALALEAVITVLEAPMFKTKSYDAEVTQYMRKGEVIKLHPSLNTNPEFDHLAPPPEKLKAIKDKLAALPEWRDPLFRDGKEEVAFIEDEFIPAFDRHGTVGYVLSSQVYVYYEDSREFAQKVPKHDPTDYRLSEPLPKNYPLKTVAGHRGQMAFTFSQPYNESYHYQDAAKTKSYSNPMGLQTAILWKASHDQQDRLFFGANLVVKAWENTYSFFDRRKSQEKYIQAGFGPMIVYDAYKGTENRLSLAFSINVNPLSFSTISQNNGTVQETRTYRAFNLSSRLGIQYHRKKIVDDLDFVLGTSVDFESQASYQAQDGGGNQTFWRKLGGDTYKTRAFLGITGYAGLQVAY